jgi:hypothetical protein
MTPLNNFINGETQINFDECTADAYFDLEDALDNWGWSGKDLVEISHRLETLDDFDHFLWIAKNIVHHRIEDLVKNLNHVCRDFTK